MATADIKKGDIYFADESELVTTRNQQRAIYLTNSLTLNEVCFSEEDETAVTSIFPDRANDTITNNAKDTRQLETMRLSGNASLVRRLSQNRSTFLKEGRFEINKYHALIGVIIILIILAAIVGGAVTHIINISNENKEGNIMLF